MWVLLAISASLFWGLTYVFNEQVYKHISVITSLALASFVIFITMIAASYFSDHLKPDLLAIASSRRLLLYVIAGIIALLVAELFIGFSITTKSATLAGLVEISYPIFIALFAYLFFKEKISLPTIIGAALVFCGIGVIYFFNK